LSFTSIPYLPFSLVFKITDCFFEHWVKIILVFVSSLRPLINIRNVSALYFKPNIRNLILSQFYHFCVYTLGVYNQELTKSEFLGLCPDCV